ncbi:hypothetical protein [Variovorax sp.]|uniref:hypothetical protein n=1 Tax=Variovorax sp. TaxID=1871043 RepID=UPI002D2FB825|nr:hypothetical protein [Variovorax sp.]HYP83247.1 hypothetical protein [Variovorax sp.]
MNDSNERLEQVADDLKRVGQRAADHAKDAALGLSGMADAAGKKLDSTKVQVDQLANYLTLSINADPIKAVLVTAGASALLTALLVAAMGGGRRR